MKNVILLTLISVLLNSCCLNKEGNVLEPRKILTLEERIGDYEYTPLFGLAGSKVFVSLSKSFEDVEMSIDYYENKDDPSPKFTDTAVLGDAKTKKTKFDVFLNGENMTAEFMYYEYLDVTRLLITMTENGTKTIYSLKQKK